MPLEMNIGLAACLPAGDARPFFEMLGQGRADLYFARQYARLSRLWGSRISAERHIYSLAAVAGLAAVAIRFDGRLGDDAAADLISFIFERGMNMPAPHAGSAPHV